MNLISKATFISRLKEAYIRIDHMSDRQLDYKYLEYNLYLILDKHAEEHDFSLLGLPDKLEIVTYPLDYNYNIYNRTHVTLNTELYKLYACGYFNDDEHFIRYVTSAINHYISGGATIKKLSKAIRKVRLKYMKEEVGY